MSKITYDISIIIPTKNREKQLLRSVKAIISQLDYDKNCEVIIVNDGSTYSSQTVTLLSKMPHVTYFEIPASGPAKARNYGAKRSKGWLLAFIDDDCVVDSTWLNTIRRYYFKHKQEAVFVGGGVKPLQVGASLINQYLCHIHHLDGPILTNGKITNMASANLIVRKVDFQKVNGFDERFPYAGAEDQNLIWKLSKIGTPDFTDKLRVYHNHNISLSSFFNKYRRYGRGVSLHNYLTKDSATDSAVYNNYCQTYWDILLKFNRIISRSKQTRNRFESSQDISFITRFAYFLLSIIQESAFQIGSVDMQSDLVNNPSMFKLLTN